MSRSTRWRAGTRRHKHQTRRRRITPWQRLTRKAARHG